MQYEEDVLAKPHGKVLIVIDMQYDFIDGTLANEDAAKLVKPICNFIKSGDWREIILTRDTHQSNYLKTQEGKNLPVEHCLEGTRGWCIHEDIYREALKHPDYTIVDKSQFGYQHWDSLSYDLDDCKEIIVVGTVTDICVISNVLILKALFPEVKVTVVENLCSGLTKEKHDAAIEVMKSCQVNVINTETI